MFCPLQASCVAFGTGRQDALPVKTIKIKQKVRFFYYIILKYEDKYAMRKRELGDIWTGLYDFALAESEQDMDLTLHPLIQKIKKSNINFTTLQDTPTYKHQLTHQTLYIKFSVIAITNNEIFDFQENTFQWYTLPEMQNLPKPILIANVIEKLNLF